MGLHFGGHTPSRRGLAASTRGNYAIQGSDTPATRRQRASHGAKPPLLPVWRAPEGPEGLAAVPVGGGGAWPGFECKTEAHVRNPAPLVWRAPEGPEGTGGLRGAAPNEVRTPSLAGGRALRRPEHPWGHKAARPAHSEGPEAPQRLGPHTRVCQLLTG